MKLLVHLLMLAFLSGGSAEVVQDFEQSCGQFFAKNRSPTKFPGTQYKQICQTLNGNVYYATFYDTNKKIPVYSAYQFTGKNKCRRADRWYIEPKLDDNNAGRNMAYSTTVQKQLRGVHQALNKDYDNAGYDKGHLAPVYQATSQYCADATFTLTNAAPQNPHFNRGSWKKLERQFATDLSKNCIQKNYPAYIVTGVVPSNGPPLKNRVNIPGYFWTAYCCLDQNNRCIYSEGATGTNDNNGIITKMTVAALQTRLGQLYGTAFTVFY